MNRKEKKLEAPKCVNVIFKRGYIICVKIGVKLL